MSKQELKKSLNRLSEKDVEIKIQPNTLDILSGSVKTSNVFGAVLIDLKTGLMPDWQQNIKQVLDILIAVLCLIILIPISYLCCHQGKAFFKRPGNFSTGTNWVQRQTFYDVQIQVNDRRCRKRTALPFIRK